MTVWSDEELYGLKDFTFGVSTGWRPVGEYKLVRRFETPSIVADAVAVPAEYRDRNAKTTVMFEIDQILPAMLAAQTMMEETGWPSRKNNPQQYAIWNKARSAQATIFKGLVKQLQHESPEFSLVLDGVGGTLSARGVKDPQLWRETLVIPIEVQGAVVSMWVKNIIIRKRPGELDKSNLLHP
ncbi:hypothetical protein M2119_000606 [Aurantimicrobium minutum]|uniref:hypothetical protein n=1 Tax=Aurantimicrobium minutum TaxID=708131 RepID=UPI002475B8ED|nr:hypothetical protein [Aurantimicrobium minutum]MDH6532369.1 hypothetical protein [Aurantimicrobium minutum]